MRSEDCFESTNGRVGAATCAVARAPESSDLETDRPRPVILRLDRVIGTSANAARVRERIRLLNAKLAASGVPLRLRVV